MGGSVASMELIKTCIVLSGKSQRNTTHRRPNRRCENNINVCHPLVIAVISVVAHVSMAILASVCLSITNIEIHI
jgi:hypothetical protein